ncbi:MAG: TrmH family RNA methyltransferase [Deltaproteobacteria bacterium]
MKEITSRENEIIKQAVRIKQKKYRQKEGLYLIEGHKMLREVMAGPQTLVRVFMTHDSLEVHESKLRELSGVECYLVDERLMSLICDTQTPQGIAALVRIPHYDLRSLLNNKEGLLLLLDRIQDPGNMGTILRTAWGFPVDGVLLTADCVDPFGPKAVRASMGGIFHVPVMESITLEILKDFKEAGYQIMGSEPAADKTLFDQDLTGGRIIVIGNESRGIGNDVLNLCDHYFRIPLNPRVDSLNAAMACAIIAVEALRQRSSGQLS